MSLAEPFLPMALAHKPKPFVRIEEQPQKSLRFRYDSEGRPSAITGVSGTSESRVPFSVEVVGYTGRILAVVSCVTHDEPFRPHPHNLVGLNCKDGLCRLETELSSDSGVVAFPSIAVQCIKRTAVKEALRVREERKVDPFFTGFGHKEDVRSINLNIMRLCVQVFLMDERRKPLSPVVSNAIFNKKTIPDPIIYRLSHCNCYVSGSTDEIILLCTKITKEDVQIQFLEKKNGSVVWKSYASFHPSHIYSNTSICFTPPKYPNQNILEPVEVWVRLVRPSDGVKSNLIRFEYLPLDSIPGALREKRIQDNSKFAQFFQAVGMKMEADVSCAMVLQDIPSPVNDINRCESSSLRGSSPGDMPWNIMAEGFDTDVNLDSATGISQVLDIDYSQMELQPIHISSGDLEMADVGRLSGSFQENLVL